MSVTKQPCGPYAVALYIDNGQGRRLAVASPDRHGIMVPTVLATNRAEARAAIAALRSLAEELPPGPGEEPTVTPPPKPDGPTDSDRMLSELADNGWRS